MEIKERKLRKVGNSVVMTLSKEFLESIGATATDTVYVDEVVYNKKSKIFAISGLV